MVRLISIAALLLMLCNGAAARTTTPWKDKGGLSDDDRRKYDAFFLEAIVQREKGNATAAFDLLRYCARLNPEAPEVYFYLAQYYRVLKDKEKSLENFKKAAELNPDNSTYMETLAQAYISSGQYDNATTVLEKLVSRNTDREDVLATLVELYAQQADYDHAIATLERLELLEGKSERLSYTKSEIYTQQGNKKAAIEEMKQLADQYPNDLNYRRLYGDMLMKNGQEKKALEIFKGILDEEPGNNGALIAMRAYYKQQGDTLAADSMTRRILISKATDSPTRIYVMRQEIEDSENSGGDSTRILKYFDLVEAIPLEDADFSEMHAAYMSLKNMPRDSIERVLKHVLTIAPDNAGVRLQLVGYAFYRDDLQRVVELCRAARQYNPEEIAFYYYQGMAYYRMDNYAEALDALQNGTGAINDEAKPEFVSDYYGIMGELLYHLGRKEEAYAAYDSCLQWKDDNISSLNNFAYYLCMDDRDLDKAERMSYKTIEAEPENELYLDTYAWILFTQKRYAEAKIYIEQALRCDTDSNAVIFEHAGDIYAMNGDTTQAVAMWQEAAKQEPDNKLLARKIKLKKYLKKE